MIPGAPQVLTGSDGAGLLLDLAGSRDPINALGTRLICVDGLAGAGKTTLAGHLEEACQQREVSCAVVHMDELYPGWTGLLVGSETVWTEVIEPLTRGEGGEFRRFDWHREAFDGVVPVPAAQVVVIEGCGSAPPAVDEAGALVVYVTAPEQLRLARGLDRDGEAMRGHWLAFMADEATLEARHRTRERAAVVIDGVGTVLRWPPV